MKRLGNVQRLVLGILTLHPGMTSSEVATELHRDETQISDVMLRLEELGYIDGSNTVVWRKEGLTYVGQNS